MTRPSIIEQAAKRLEELKRSGVEVPAPLLRGHSPARSGPPTGLPGSDAAGAGDARGRPERLARGNHFHTPHGSSVLPTPRPAGIGRPEVGGKTSATVEIDLERLARAGYLVPGQATTQLASEFRLIKRPLLRNVDRETPDSRTSLIMVTSAVAGEGKTYCSINLALSIAMEVDTSVLLVDADVVRPALLERFGLPAAPGLLDLLTNDVDDISDVLLKTNIPKLSLLPAGAPRSMSTELLASDAMDKLLIDLATRYPDRVIVLDAPPLLLTTESPVLASRVGQVVLVIDSLNTSRHKVAQAFATVESCPIVLSLLNKCRNTPVSDGYGYSY
jgi:protein-tyrosine kinase